MIQFHFTTPEEVSLFTKRRDGESKLGETVQFCTALDQIKQNTAHFVIFGVCEDIGVQANYGKRGTRTAWNAFLKSFINCQDNVYNKGSNMLLLGQISVTPGMDTSQLSNPKNLGDLVTRIDKKVAMVVALIVQAGKIPIIIGGGHNNAYGALKGSTITMQKPIHCVNFDAHTDLRKTDYRHSGNGFSYALEEAKGALLKSYHIFGLHKNYSPQYILDNIDTNNLIYPHFLEDMFNEHQQMEAFKQLLATLPLEATGVEIDCDCIADFPSSAQSPSGFKLESLRYFLTQLSSNKKCCYLHICEASPTKKTTTQIGKALSYLVTDFIRTHRENNTL